MTVIFRFKINLKASEPNNMNEDRNIYTLEWSDPDVVWLMSTFRETHDDYRLIEFDDGSFCYLREELPEEKK